MVNSAAPAMNSDQQPGAGDDGEVEVIVLDDDQYREVFDRSLEVEMENVSLTDHDYSKREGPREVRLERDESQ